MKTLYLMRHAQTVFNQLKKVQGWCDSPLTAKGIKQAELAKKYFADKGITFDAAYSSTSERASDTLELITDLPYKRVKGLKEWNFGLFESENEHLNPPLPYGDFFVRFGGEGEMEFRNRLGTAISDIMKAEQGSSILMVSHGAACAQFVRYVFKSEITLESRGGNCCILKFEYDNGIFTFIDMVNHDFSHLE